MQRLKQEWSRLCSRNLNQMYLQMYTIMEENPRYVPIQRAEVVTHSYSNPLSGKQYKVIKMF